MRLAVRPIVAELVTTVAPVVTTVAAGAVVGAVVGAAVGAAVGEAVGAVITIVVSSCFCSNTDGYSSLFTTSAWEKETPGTSIPKEAGKLPSNHSLQRFAVGRELGPVYGIRG